MLQGPDSSTSDQILVSGFTAILSQASPASFNDTVTAIMSSSIPKEQWAQVVEKSGGRESKPWNLL